MATSEYDLLEALIEARVEIEGDPAGWSRIVAGLLRELKIERGSESLLADALFDYIAAILIPKKGVKNGA